MADLGKALRAAREAAGVSLGAMAHRTNYSKALLGHIETGKRRVQDEHVIAYSRELGVPVAVLYGPRLDPLRMAHEWLARPTPARSHLEAGRQIGTSLVASLEERVVTLRHLDDFVGGRDLLPVVRRELVDAQMVARDARYTDATGRRLLVAVGELAQLVGWVASDAGRYADAEATYLSGVTAAREAGDTALVGQLFSSLAYQMANVGNSADAVLLAQSAMAGAREAVPAVRTLLGERLAWAHARARDGEQAHRALELVEDEWERRTSDDAEPEWVYWLSRDEIDVMAGRCLIELGDPTAARPLLAAAVDAYDEDHIREKALYMTWLAEALADAGDLDGARATLDGIRALADQVQSSRLDLRVANIERRVG
ncbi:helix-turn-helix domain-containing protein [Actinokineospora sp. G85]|uniref:helix-turn-helix domain-containing protein n=1 Tax=Actinokineospora sp. G85 TaxID=3406626 RepID=UPI003C780063